MNKDFVGVTYETFAKPKIQKDEQFLKRAFYFGVKLCAVAQRSPADLMVGLLEKCKQAGYKWRLGGIVAYKYYDEQRKRDLVTLKLEGNTQKNPF